MKRLSRVLLAVGLSLLFVQALWGQGFSVTLGASDGVNSASLIVGTAVGATSGIDAGQGEVELPPTPLAGVFDARLVGASLGKGVAKDIRGYVSATQTNTFHIKWQVATEGTHGDSLELTWPAGLSTVGGGYWHITDLDGNDLVDMTASTGAVISSDYSDFLITNGDNHSYTTFTYSRFWNNNDASGKQKGAKRSVTVFYWPNVHNVGEEISANAANVPLMTVGSSATQSVLLKKYSDLLKNAYVKGVWHSADSLYCLASFPHTIKGKSYAGFPVIANPAKGTPDKVAKDSLGRVGKLAKQQSKLDPTPGKMMQSWLFAQLMTLEFNLKASSAGKTPAGLGSLVINDGSAFNGLTISQLRDRADSAFSCAFGEGTVTIGEICDELDAVNHAFNKSVTKQANGLWVDTVHCDTLAGIPWRVKIVSGKAKAADKNTLQLTGWLALAQVPWLSAGSSSAPVNEHQNMLENAKPEQYSLEQNYPNPFNPTTTIKFNLVNDGFVTVKVFNMLGQEVSTLVNGTAMTQGENEVNFDASSLASGVYFYSIRVSDNATGKVMFQDMKKMMLVK